jgi:hypothetical protein
MFETPPAFQHCPVTLHNVVVPLEHSAAASAAAAAATFDVTSCDE